MMNPESLSRFNDALDSVATEHGSLFDLITIDTTMAASAIETNTKLLTDLLPRIEEWADPNIAVVPKDAVIGLFSDRPFVHGDEATQALGELLPHVQVVRRSSAEKNKDVVQFIAAGIHSHQNRVVLFERELLDKKASSYGRRTLWVGCHVDMTNEPQEPLLDAAKRCLTQRIQQDLHLASHPQLALLGLAWDKTQQETQHVGIMFRAPITSDYVAKHLENKQFKKMARSRRLRSVFMTQDDIVKGLQDLDLEPWSEHIARNIKLAPLTAKDS